MKIGARGFSGFETLAKNEMKRKRLVFKMQTQGSENFFQKELDRKNLRFGGPDSKFEDIYKGNSTQIATKNFKILKIIDLKIVI